MKTTLQINSLFAYSAKANKCSFYEFDPNINIIYGRNTSGKSSVLKSLVYTLGINDGKEHLLEILNEEVIFRVDCLLIQNGVQTPLIFVREDETLFIKYGDSPVLSFNGIRSDNSNEHIKLKKHLSNLFNFNLQLESNNEYKPAPLEAMFLPYYISQAVGWVYIRKSFSNLDFYRNFKEDYLDYYLGIENVSDRIEKHKLESLKSTLQNEVAFYSNMQSKDIDLQVTTLIDEHFSEESQKYFESYRSKQDELLKSEREYLLECNSLSYYKQRKSVLAKVSNHHQKQHPGSGLCPVCCQNLPNSIASQYEYYQDGNDTLKEIKSYAEEIKKAQSKINSLQKHIIEVRSNIEVDYQVLQRATKQNISLENWLEHKANSRLIGNLKTKLGELTLEIEKVNEQLKLYKNEADLIAARAQKNKHFLDLFTTYLNALHVKPLDEERFTLLYNISAFPYQGVELLKTLMAYHFAFNNLISQTEDIHRLPFLLDAIFKEDITRENKELIVEFVSKNRPRDTQLLITISQDKGTHADIDDYNSKYFDKKAKLIAVAMGTEERSFLQPYDAKYDQIVQSTIEIIHEENFK